METTRGARGDALVSQSVRGGSTPLPPGRATLERVVVVRVDSRERRELRQLRAELTALRDEDAAKQYRLDTWSIAYRALGWRWRRATAAAAVGWAVAIAAILLDLAHLWPGA